MDLPGEQPLRWLVTRFAGLLARHGDAIGTPELVQPTGDDFPDPFTPSSEGVHRLVARILEYAPVRDGLPVDLQFFDPAEGAGGCGDSGGSCGSGACSTGPAATKLQDRVVPRGDGYLLELPVDVAGHPVVLTSTLARCAGAIVLSEADEEVASREVGPMSELAAIVSGFGVLLASGAHVYGKSCGGARVGVHTHLSLEETSVGLALFSAVHDVRPKVARAYLEVTQREAFGEAVDWVESNPAIVHDLRNKPEVVEAGFFRIEETKGLFGKLLARRAVLVDAV